MTRQSTMTTGALMAVICGSALTVFAADPPVKQKLAAAADKTEWKVLCDGTSLKDWKVTEFGGEGEVASTDGAIVLQQGAELTGIHWAGAALPKRNYEVQLDAKRINGSDFFCGLVFPVGDSFCSFVVGGWGGGVVGLSAVDGLYAIDNQTVSYQSFDDNKWYRIRLRVSEKHIQAWLAKLDDKGELKENKRLVNLETTGKRLSVHPAVDLSKPLGVSCYSTVAAVKNIRLRELTPEEAKETPKE
jgi:hypothetical protein